MALFNLTDIKFKRETSGPLNDIVSSEYQTDILKYPIDIGTHDKGHYMVIYINQQENTAQEFRRNPSSVEPTVLRASREIGQRRGATSSSQILGVALREGRELVERAGDVLGIKTNDGGANLQKKLEGNVLRRISRTTDAIALYMPDTLNFTYNQSYSDVSTFDTFGAVGTLASAGAAAFDSARNRGTSPNNLTNLSAFALQLARDTNAFGLGGAATLGLAAFGVASNPGLELLYNSPSFRSFRFDFMFYPRSQKESKEVMKIVKKLKFHQAPEIASRTGGRFLIPPSEFDIQFFYNGTENPNIPKVSTCVLEQIDVDYAPNGFSAYEVPGEINPVEGGTGMPTGIRMSLQFKETQIITKEFLTIGELTKYGTNFGSEQSRMLDEQERGFN